MYTFFLEEIYIGNKKNNIYALNNDLQINIKMLFFFNLYINK